MWGMDLRFVSKMGVNALIFRFSVFPFEILSLSLHAKSIWHLSHWCFKSINNEEDELEMNSSNNAVGHKIRGLREQKQLSVDEIAERSGLSAEQIKAIETDETLPSLGPLIKIARALGVRLGTFLDDNDALGPVVTRAEDREHDRSISFSNDAADARKHMEYHPLAKQKTGRHMEPFIVDINPSEEREFQLSAHEGEEFIYVMSGEIEIDYGKEKYVLRQGDSIFYDSIVKHHVHGAGGQAAKILAVIYIPL